MQSNEAVNTPLLAGLAIAAGAGAVGFGVSLVAVGIEGNGSVLIGVVVATVVGLILGLPRKPLPAPNTVSAPTVASSTAAPAPAAPAAPAAAVADAVATEAAPAPEVPQEKPPVLDAARDGKPDDLQLIKGVGPKLQEMLNGMGIFHYDQIAAWSAPELAWVDDHLEGFKGRASRDEWIAQAKILAAGGSTEFSARQE